MYGCMCMYMQVGCACMDVCKDAWAYGFICMVVNALMYVCLHGCFDVRMNVLMNMDGCMHGFMCVWMYVCMYAWMCGCMDVYVLMYM